MESVVIFLVINNICLFWYSVLVIIFVMVCDLLVFGGLCKIKFFLFIVL